MSALSKILLNLKKGIEMNISFLNEMINIKNEVLCMSRDTDISIIEEPLNDFNNKFQFKCIKEEIDVLKQQLQQINHKLILSCEHIFINDEIDIDPENSIRIRYCINCEYCQDL